MDSKLKEIVEEISTFNLRLNSRIYGSLLTLGSKGNIKSILIDLWNDYFSLFPTDAPHPRIISMTIRAISERFEDPASALRILHQAQENYGYSVHPNISSLLCYRALYAHDDKTVLSIIHTISPPTINLYKSALKCAAKTGNMELLEFSYPVLEKKVPDLAIKLFPWKLYALSRVLSPNVVIDEICNASKQVRESIQFIHHETIASLLFDNVDQIDNVYFYCEQIKEKIQIQVIDLIITACGQQNDVQRAVETYQVIPEFNLKANTSTYNAIMNVYFQNNDFDIIPGVFNDLENSGCKPDVESYICLTKTYLNLKAGKFLLETIAAASNSNITLPIPLYGDSIKYFVGEGDTSASQFIVKHMKQLNIEVTTIQQFIRNSTVKLW